MLSRATRAMHVSPAVSFAVSARVWKLLAGPITTLLIAFVFTPVEQGFFYTFWSLLALQTLTDLGFTWVIIYVASHESAKLEVDSDGGVQGDADALGRLASLVQLARRWYAIAALVFAVGVGAGGLVFFSQRAAAVDWQGPWVALVALYGLGIFFSPLIAILEGCNQMEAVYRNRFAQGVVANLVLWTGILLGAVLWAAVFAEIVRILFEGWLLLVRYRRLWHSLRTAPPRELDWRTEVWPLQWRVGIQSVFRYAAFQLLSPVLFHYQGAVAAGRMGMTWTVLTALQEASFAWVRTRAAEFGKLIAHGQRAELEHLFRRVTTVSWLLLAVTATGFSVAVWVLDQIQHPLAEMLSSRLLPPLPTAVFALGLLLWHLPQCLGLYIRAHKVDPLMPLSVVANLAIGGIVVYGGSQFGAAAVGWGLLGVVSLVTLPGTLWIWWRFRRLQTSS